MGIFNITWLDIRIQEEKKKKEGEKYERPFVQPQIPCPPPQKREKPKKKDEKDEKDGIIVFDM